MTGGLQRPPADDVRAVQAAHDALLGGDQPERAVRDVVLDSWRRSARAGIDSEHNLAPLALSPDALADYRAAHPLSQVFPLLYDVLGRAAEACDSVMAIGDAHGHLLWVCGPPRILTRAEGINFVEGASWDEAQAGTNAPGTALRLDSAVQIRGPEHFTRSVQRWSCVAAPIHDPVTQAILGVVDVTGGRSVGSPQTLAMVRAAARMAEAELGRLRLLGLANGLAVAVEAGTRPLVVDGLGRPDCQLDDGNRVIRLSRRHSEILAVLADHPGGLSTEQLAVELYADDTLLSTVRAEMTRFRALLGEETLASRPYRLRVPVTCDWQQVHADLDAGRIADAIRHYRGPLLPCSDAPGIVERRDRLERHLRASVLASGNVDYAIAWTRARWGAGDLEMWELQRRLLPADSPLHAVAGSEISRLQQEYGLAD